MNAIGSKTISLLCIVCLLAILASGSALTQQYTVTDLSLPSGFTYPDLSGINASGQVIGGGISSNRHHAFLWQNGTVTDLTPPGFSNSQSVSINDFGQIIGYAYNDYRYIHAFLWQHGAFTDLTPPGSLDSYAAAINNSGQIVGSSGHAFLWQNGSFTQLVTPGFAYSSASSINASGGNSWLRL